MRILIVEDDATIASYLKKGLEEESFSVDVAYDRVDGLTFVREKNYAVMVIDWMLPKLSGIDICTIARKNGINTPIMILSAKRNIQDRVEGLDC